MVKYDYGGHQWCVHWIGALAPQGGQYQSQSSPQGSIVSVKSIG